MEKEGKAPESGPYSFSHVLFSSFSVPIQKAKASNGPEYPTALMTGTASWARPKGGTLASQGAELRSSTQRLKVRQPKARAGEELLRTEDIVAAIQVFASRIALVNPDCIHGNRMGGPVTCG